MAFQAVKHLPIFKQAVVYSERTAKAYYAFTELCQQTRQFSDLEKDNYLKTYKGLYNEYQCLGWFKRRLFTSYVSTRKFIICYTKIDALQQKNNAIFQDAEEERRAEEERIRRERVEQERIQKLKLECDTRYQEFLDKNPYIAISDWEHLKKELQNIYPLYEVNDEIVNQRNQQFRVIQKEKNHEYFDTLLNYPLDEQQRDAIVSLGENVLVTAAAGSGKTSTIVAKTHYLVDKLHVDPRSILVVTYTRKAADELFMRVGVEGVECNTFHKHALDTIACIKGEQPTICDSNVLEKIFDSLTHRDTDFQNAFFQYQTLQKSLLQYDYEYKHYADYLKALQEYGKLAPYRDMDKHLCYMKSRQEMELMVILTELGLNVRYEEAYPISTASRGKRQYMPDFTIHYEKEENGVTKDYAIYFEHFGIDELNRVPIWFGEGKQGGWVKANREYNEGIQWKKELHKNNQTTLLYTTSGDFEHGLGYVRDKVRGMLEQLGVPIHPLSNEEKSKRLAIPITRSQDSLLKLVSGFITLMKANGKSIQSLIEGIPNEDLYRDRNIFLLKTLVGPIYTHYEDYLKHNGQYDYTDCLIKATALLKENQIYNYQYILVDEFQDMSMDKYQYLNALRNAYPRTRIFCVGDDWQSIYRFSGSDISLFSQFEIFNGPTEECKIEATHRFGNPLLERSSNFILANPTQKKKTLKADDNHVTYLAFAGYKDEMLERDIIVQQIKKLPEKARIYILSRYKYDIGNVFPEVAEQVTKENNSAIELSLSGHKVQALTVHSAKGLEADYVFLINCNSGYNDYGFPSQVSDDPILEYVLSSAESYEHAEERRLFYVAITRAKRATYVLYDKMFPSLFVTEMGEGDSSETKTTMHVCPRCGIGRIKYIRDGYASNGAFFTVRRCTNQDCDLQNDMIFFNKRRSSVEILSFEKFLQDRNVSIDEESRISVANRMEYACPVLVVPCADSKNGELLLSLDPKYDAFVLSKFYKAHLAAGDLNVKIFKGENVERLLLTLEDAPRQKTIYYTLRP